MSTLIEKLEKRIYQNKPSNDANGQYSYGHISPSEVDSILGENSDLLATDFDLYTTVENWSNDNLVNYPGGIHNGGNGKIVINNITTRDADSVPVQEYGNIEAPRAPIVNRKLSIYLFDDSTTDGKDVLTTNSGESLSTIPSIEDNGARVHTNANIGYNNGEELNTTINNVFGRTGVSNDSSNQTNSVASENFFQYGINGVATLVLKSQGDVNDTYDYSHKDHTDSSSHSHTVTDADERNRVFVRANIPKVDILDLWSKKDGSNINYQFTFTHAGNPPKQTDNPLSNIEDNYGVFSPVVFAHNHTGSYSGSNFTQPIWGFDSIDFDLVAPVFNPENAIQTIENGGMNAAWVDVREDGWWCIDKVRSGFTFTRQGLNPRYDMDFFGFSDEFYLDNIGTSHNNFFNTSLLRETIDTRPFSFVSSSFDVDIQSYYDGESTQSGILRSLTSAPNIVKTKVRLANSNVNNVPEYIDDTLDSSFDTWHFIVDWDDTDDGININNVKEEFPKTIQDLSDLNTQGLFLLKPISETIEHNYLTPGIKNIKVLVFSTINCNLVEWSDYVQAVDWKLLSVKININNDSIVGGFADYDDVGGDNFTFLPYVGKKALKALDDDGNNINGFAPSGRQYESSHILVSGLSKESSYISSLNKIIKEDKFSTNDIQQKFMANKAKALSPIGIQNEWGDFLGKSDISQIRFFDKPVDMRSLLNINTVYTENSTGGEEETGDVIYPYNDKNFWDCRDWNGLREHCFEESPLDSLFIGEYDQYKNSCLFEINCDELDNKSFLDTNGNGIKGILVGDFSIKKDSEDIPVIRDSYIRTPKVEKNKDDGAL